DPEGTGDGEPVGARGEVVLQGPTVQLDQSRPRNDPHPDHGLLATTGAEPSPFLCRVRHARSPSCVGPGASGPPSPVLVRPRPWPCWAPASPPPESSSAGASRWSASRRRPAGAPSHPPSSRWPRCLRPDLPGVETWRLTSLPLQTCRAVRPPSPARAPDASRLAGGALSTSASLRGAGPPV